jgi:biopolymer transport protein ExbB/TolQ
MLAADRRLAAIREAQRDIQERIVALRIGDEVAHRDVLDRARLAAEESVDHARIAALRAAEADEAAARMHEQLAAAHDADRHRSRAAAFRRRAAAHRAIADRLAFTRTIRG